MIINNPIAKAIAYLLAILAVVGSVATVWALVIYLAVSIWQAIW